MIYKKSIGEALQAGEAAMKKVGIIRPRRHAELLLEKATSKDRVNLYMNARHVMSEVASREYSQMLDRRLGGEPVQYITGSAPFFGRDFHVGAGVFIPRFETELLIERLIVRSCNRREHSEQIQILDLCCGTGILGITAALEIPDSKVTLVDNSAEALIFTAMNVRSLEVENQIEIIHKDVLARFPQSWARKFDFIMANPPYIPITEIAELTSDVQREPHEALTDGGNGLLFYRTWGSNINLLLKPGGIFFCEIDGYIADYIHNLMGDCFSEILLSRDLDGIQRVCEATLEK